MNLLREGYKTSTQSTIEGVAKTGQVSDKGTVEQVEHWSGRVDAVVRPKALGLKLTTVDGAPLSKAHTDAIGEHQAAINELAMARASGVKQWVETVEARVKTWKSRILETQ